MYPNVCNIFFLYTWTVFFLNIGSRRQGQYSITEDQMKNILSKTNQFEISTKTIQDDQVWKIILPDEFNCTELYCKWAIIIKLNTIFTLVIHI